MKMQMGFAGAPASFVKLPMISIGFFDSNSSASADIRWDYDYED